MSPDTLQPSVSAIAPAMTEGPPVEASTLVEAFQRTVRLYGERTALRTIGGAVELTWAQLDVRMRKVAAGLAVLGLGKGDTLAILMTNSVENHLVDYAAAHLGVIPFGIFNSSAPEQIAYQVANAGAQVIITEAALLPRVRTAVAMLAGQVQKVVVSGEFEPDELSLALADLEASGAPDFDLDAIWPTLGADDLECIIFTSGTTGPPKPVQWSNRTVMAQLRGLYGTIPLPHEGIISFLPMAHAGGRINGHHLATVHGATLTACPVMNDVPKALLDARPDVLFSSPRLFEKLQVAIDGLIERESGPLRRQLREALERGVQVSHAEEDGKTAGPGAGVVSDEQRLADVALFRPVLARLGLDRINVMIIGGAPVAAEVVHYFRALGMPMLEAYGTTEASLNVFNTIEDFRTGTAGKALPGVELRVTPDGELLCRAEMNMVGYRNNPEADAATIDEDGWVHTGDIVVIDADGFVKVVDRKKEIIINSAGKNMSPAVIESTILGESPLMAQVVAIGDGRRYVTALITLDPDAVATFARANNLDGSPEEVSNSPRLRAEIEKAVAAGNTHLNSNEQIKKFLLLPGAWTPDSDELTPTAKLKRRVIHKKYAAQIDSMYV